MLLCHTEGATTGRYGILPQGELTHRQRMIEAINYPGLKIRGDGPTEPGELHVSLGDGKHSETASVS